MVATSAYVPPGPTTTAVTVAVEQEKNAPSSSSSQISFFSWFSWQTDEIKPKKAPVEEKELRRREMVAKLTAHYTERSEKKLSELPLVGMNSKVPIQYKIGSLVVKKTKEGVVSLLKQAGALTKIAVINSMASESTPVCLSCCKNVPDVACMEVELHHHTRLIGDWMPVPMDTESTNYPLVGLHAHQSKVIDALISFAERPSVQKSLSSFMHSLEQFLSMEDMAPINSLSQETNCPCHTFLQNILQTVDNNMLQEEPSIKQHHTSPPLNTVSKQCPSRSNVEYLSDWEMFVDEPTYMVFRKQYADTGLHQFKVIGRYDDIAAQDFLEVQVSIIIIVPVSEYCFCIHAMCLGVCVYNKLLCGHNNYSNLISVPLLCKFKLAHTQVDEELRMSWDHSVAKLKTVDYDQNSDCGLVHWVMKYPVSSRHVEAGHVTVTLSLQFPMTSREYVYVYKRWTSPEKNAIVVVNRFDKTESVSRFTYINYTYI